MKKLNLYTIIYVVANVACISSISDMNKCEEEGKILDNTSKMCWSCNDNKVV